MDANLFFSLSGPLDVLPAEGQMRAANFEGFHDLVRNLGGDPRRILERYDIDPRTVSDSDHYIECRSLAAVFEYCSSYFDDPLFGLRLAQLQEPDVFGLVTALCRTAPTFGDAVRRFVEYIPIVHSPASILELEEGKETTEVRWSGHIVNGDHDGAQGNYEAALLILKLLREVGGRAFMPSRVNMTVDVRAKDIAEIERSFGCPFHGSAPDNSIAFRTSMLSQPVANSSRQLFKLLDSYLDRVKGAKRQTVVDRVEDYVRGSLQLGNCSVEHCAKKLGMSSRSLQSHLNDCGLKFSEILEKQRVVLARSYLAREDLSLVDVAYLLGYAEQSSFGRAFKRWTGLTPQGYREAKGAGTVPAAESLSAVA